jgi:hypothetical protein
MSRPHGSPGVLPGAASPWRRVHERIEVSNAWRRREGTHAALVRELDIPSPFDQGEFVASLERQRHRPVRPCPFISGPGIPAACGLVPPTTTSTTSKGRRPTTRPTSPARAGAHAAEPPRRPRALRSQPLTVPSCPRDGYPVPVEYLRELGPSLYRCMRVVVAGRQGFRVQPEDRAELGAVDAGVADESKKFHMFLE